MEYIVAVDKYRHFVKAAEKGGYINKDAVLIKHTENFRVVKVK